MYPFYLNFHKKCIKDKPKKKEIDIKDKECKSPKDNKYYPQTLIDDDYFLLFDIEL